MLTLTRKKDEPIITLTEQGELHMSVREINGQQVRTGINAPEDITIIRAELVNLNS